MAINCRPASPLTNNCNCSGNDLQQHESSEEDSDVDIEGSPDKPAKAQAPLLPLQLPADLPFNIMLTGYSLFERTSGAQISDRKFLRNFKWSHMILDEGHAVKNAASGRSLRLRRYQICPTCF